MTRTIDICICTFRRPELTDLLASLSQINVPSETQPKIIVIDNDDTDMARARVQAAQMPFPLTYLHVPGRNISIARNAALAAAQAEFAAFLDDDETVTPNWLLALVAAADRDRADVVFGPVVSVYPDHAPNWIVRGDYHSKKPPPDGASLTTGYTSNVLMRRSAPALEGLSFAPDLGRSGGEDTIFFRQVNSRGGHLTFAQDAVVLEKVHPDRLSLRWLVNRKFRSGQSHARAFLETMSSRNITWLRLCATGATKGAYCAVRAAMHPLDRDRRYFWIIRGALHAGVVVHCFGGRKQVLYGQT